MRALNLYGQRFGEWLVIGKEEPYPGVGSRWRCRCSCGTEAVILGAALRSGRRSRCRGCRQVKHGDTAKGSTSPEYLAWAQAKSRCVNPKGKMYKHYGGRGITMCKEWQDSYSAFLGHIGRKPGPKFVLDRIENDKGYEPGNVRWATFRTSILNRRCSLCPPTWTKRAVGLRAKGLSWSEVSRRVGASRKQIQNWVKRSNNE